MYPRLPEKPRNCSTGFDINSAMLPIAEKPGAFIAMLDTRRPDNHLTSSYIWLPIRFANDRSTIEWHDEWDLSVFPTK